ncbi:MAG TPA: sensor histidine kinase [Candidatus Enterocloster excrementipullorum]|uniref:histidine kinase n=1 Tax=Candidatus Enterocloster excrementipullorum TaxID=2838559 RepID=A0A9D2MZQ4_9FIRM|nr:sensor histidine kinase [Candidatus Enterocloster excrementipullorum]
MEIHSIKPARDSIRSWWLSISLKKKFGAFAAAVVLTTAIIALLSLFAANFAFFGFGTILEDNAKCHRFQSAISQEALAFNTYVRGKNDETLGAYESACKETALALQSLPFSYEAIGRERYAKTWSIHNTYESYILSRDKVAALDSSAPGYVESLYEVFSLQNYLEQYAEVLTALTLEAGNTDYLNRLPIFRVLPWLLLTLGAALIWLVLRFTRLLRHSVVSPVESLALLSRKIAQNDFSAPDLPVESRDEVGELVHAFNLMKHATASYITALREKQEMAERLHSEELERVNTEKALEATRLEMLKSQVNPHFLFNTLNTIACMAQLEEAATTEKMITSMSSLLRYNLKTTENEVILARELKIVEDYLYIQQIRFGSRIHYRKRVDVDEHSVLIPSFSLQPLVENAIIHGLAKKEQGGTLHLHIWSRQNQIVLSVADSGAGMDKKRLEELRDACKKESTSKAGIGLGNIYKRLQMMYQDGELCIYSRANIGTVVQLRIPLKKS